MARYSPEQYLDWERQSPIKSEYLAGEIFAMAGASESHNLIVANCIGELRAVLKGRPCKTYPTDMKVKTGDAGLFTYPDVSVVCGEARFHDARRDVLLNPLVIVEVLSPSTEAYDRGEKFAHYRRLDSLQDYLLVSSHTARIERYSRSEQGQWGLAEAVGLEASISLPALGLDLPLAEIYALVDFEPHFHSQRAIEIAR